MIRIFSTIAFALILLPSFAQEVQSNINAEWINSKKVAFIGFDDVFTQQSKADIADKWNLGTVLDPRQTRANQNVIIDTNVVIVAPVMFMNDGDSLLGIFAFQGSKKWNSVAKAKNGMMMWPAKVPFLARVIIDKDKFVPHMLVTYLASVNDLLNWNLSTQDSEVLSIKMQEGEWVGDKRMLYVDSLNLTQKTKRTNFKALNIKNLKIVKNDNLKLALRDRKTDAYYLDRKVITVNGKRESITYLYSLNNGLAAFYIDALPERISGEITDEYLKFLTQPIPPKGGLDPKFQKRDINYCLRY
ncbi:MAG: hypothetical protein GC193_05975 [Cryomorphaceae bacterium]|nr:hypothetical protein [Cryomorphaceae bacterium]